MNRKSIAKYQIYMTFTDVFQSKKVKKLANSNSLH